MGAVGHLVARQTIEIIASDRIAAEALSVRTSGAADRLAAAIEHSLDAVGIAIDLRIERVELDLGACDTGRWEDALADGIRENLAAKITQMVDRGEATRREPGAAALMLLGEFARTGRLPWWASAEDSPTSAVAALTAGGCDPAAVRAILTLPQASERFVRQLDERELLALVSLARPELPEDAAVAAVSLARAELAGREGWAEPEHARREAIWCAVLREAGLSAWPTPAPRTSRARSDARDFATARFRAAVARRLGIETAPEALGDAALAASSRRGARAPSRDGPPPLPELASALTGRLLALRSSHPWAATVLHRLAELAPHLKDDAASALEAVLGRSGGPVPLADLVGIFGEAGTVSDADLVRWREMEVVARAEAGEEDHDAVPVGNCGLVTLWPFLPQFFASLGLTADERFRDAAARHRAARLLHFLASGAVAAPEQDLPLAKVLAGIAIDAVHEPGEPLAPFETGSADALLEAVLGHAPMLGRIGIAGLREAFLLRPGLLSTRDGHWLLRPEPRSIDILLERLPWSFGWVPLPWMPEPLQVEW